MSNTQLGIEFEHVNTLKIQNVWKSSDAFTVILPQGAVYNILVFSGNI